MKWDALLSGDGGPRLEREDGKLVLVQPRRVICDDIDAVIAYVDLLKELADAWRLGIARGRA